MDRRVALKRVLCIAESCCDLVFGGLPKFPGQGEELYGEHFSVQAGGGANTPIRLARLKVPTFFWTAFGTDFAGEVVRKELRTAGVKLVSGIHPDAKTPVSAVLSTDKDRAFASVAGSGPLISDLSALRKAIAKADIVHTYLGYCRVYPIAEYCREHEKILSVDSSFLEARDETTDGLISLCDYWKGNEQEAMRITNTDLPETAIQKLAGIVRRGAVITLGEKGSIGCERGGEIIRQPAVVCGPFRDSCGAGDAYAAGFLSGIANGESFRDCMKHGAAEAGMCVTQFGGCAENADIIGG